MIYSSSTLSSGRAAAFKVHNFPVRFTYTTNNKTYEKDDHSGMACEEVRDLRVKTTAGEKKNKGLGRKKLFSFRETSVSEVGDIT